MRVLPKLHNGEEKAHTLSGKPPLHPVVQSILEPHGGQRTKESHSVAPCALQLETMPRPPAYCTALLKTSHLPGPRWVSLRGGEFGRGAWGPGRAGGACSGLGLLLGDF